MARVVVYYERLDEIDTSDAMRKIADAVARDARVLVPKETGRLASGISVTEVRNGHAVIQVSARNPRSNDPHKPYPFWVEKGTHKNRAHPFLRPAAYRYRTTLR